MAIVGTILIFILFAVIGSAIAYKKYLRPKEAIERVMGQPQVFETAPHPSLAMHDLMERIGDYVPISPKDVALQQRRMMRGGIRNPNAIKMLYGAKVALGLLLVVLAIVALAAYETDPGNKVAAALAAGVLGYWAPNRYVLWRVDTRKREIARGLPNALDLMVICVESGLGLDQAIMQVAKELDKAHPDIAEEFGFVNLELKAGKARMEALRNLGERTGVEELKRLVAVLIQADRFGTSIAQSLRGHADYMRIQCRQNAEEKAAKVGVKLIFPIFFCILPSLFVVTLSPIVFKIVRDLYPMMMNL